VVFFAYVRLSQHIRTIVDYRRFRASEKCWLSFFFFFPLTVACHGAPRRGLSTRNCCYWKSAEEEEEEEEEVDEEEGRELLSPGFYCSALFRAGVIKRPS
jgi:hypothetical protein